MRLQFVAGYVIVAIFVLLSFFNKNYEFMVYAAATAIFLGLLHATDKWFNYSNWALWGVDVWMASHILGGMLPFGDSVLYNAILIDLVGEPYLILKYDQVIHAFCYFVMALLLWSIVNKIANKRASFGVLSLVVVLAAIGVGGINEILEFATTVFFDNNVGGYENTAIDLVANTVGACLAIPFFKKLK